jgi:hypothetical protein
MAGCGGAGSGSRIEESYQVTFGRLGDETTVADLPTPAVDSGPGDGRDPWPVLLGFVRWQDGHVVATAVRSGGVGLRYAGVRADTVAARSGRLALRPDPTVQMGRPGLVLDGAQGLTFGRQRADGSVDRLLEVSPKGDLFVAGAVSAAAKAGQVGVVSGRATDGMLLPLPVGVTEDLVAQGGVGLHVQVTPRLDRTEAVGSGTVAAGPTECTVDADRRVRSRVQWVRFGEETEVVDLPAPVDFLVVATALTDAGAAPGGQP